ncbi:MAG: hypothetical protein B6247_30580 [Candidatus Parabeggiatoa sp. nov. 2]|nr:MAG: hypothetical protein B6247_30580 [Beggiatoa sp. 4572_84]
MLANNINRSQRQEHILIVDDVATNIQILTILLTENGYKVSSAPDGYTALKMVESNYITLPIQLDEFLARVKTQLAANTKQKMTQMLAQLNTKVVELIRARHEVPNETIALRPLIPRYAYP